VFEGYFEMAQITGGSEHLTTVSEISKDPFLISNHGSQKNSKSDNDI
jgi:hypothetical protein